jgi:hypothetical protein
MEHRWNEIDRGKTEVLGEKPVPVPICPPQIPHGHDSVNEILSVFECLNYRSVAMPLTQYVSTNQLIT